MKILGKTAIAALMGASALAFMASTASARIACNDEGDCWHSPGSFAYPAGVHVMVHPDDWRWKAHDHYRWHEHEGRGYWHSGIWVGIP